MVYFNRFSLLESAPSNRYEDIATRSTNTHTSREQTHSSSQGRPVFDSSLTNSISHSIRENISNHPLLPRVDQQLMVEELVDNQLLRYLQSMSSTLDDTRYELEEREERIRLMMCRELLTVGYKIIKDKMDIGEIPLGELRYGSASTFVRVGPVSEFVAPRLDVERMWCCNQKAIDIMERWPTFDDFYDVWNGVFSSSDHGYRDKYPESPITSFVTLDRDQLETYWSKACERVEALKRIDDLKQSIREGRLNNDNRNVRRRLMH
jgi:anti-sigma28 factor (negative regulator of flagellin synthesis)